jgi:3-methyladenine DNA glycosylase Tag
MRPFSEIVALAEQHHGAAWLTDTLRVTQSKSPVEVAATPDDRILALMTRRVFSAGFSTKVIEQKWSAFEEAFAHFDPPTCAHISEADFDALLQNSAIIRNGAKIASVQVNAQMLLDMAAEKGSAARFIADCPDADYADLLDILKSKGSRLGGDTGMRVLRDLGKPAYILTKDVIAALIREGVIDTPSIGKRQARVIQGAFNHWSAESGRDLTQISRILALSMF